MSITNQNPNNFCNKYKNFGLACLRKFIDDYLKSAKKDTSEINSTTISKIRKEIIKEAENKSFNLSLTKAVMEETKNALLALDYDVIDVTARLDYKAISGMSEGLFHLIFEVGLNYDELLDVPYIPGSTIKGIMRSRLYELTKNKGEELFGPLNNIGKDNAWKGKIVVSDAYPIPNNKNNNSEETKLLTGDILNPHYYKNNEAVKSEYEVMPTPIIHISIRDNVKFRFLIGIEKNANPGEAGKILNVKSAKELVMILLLYSLKTGMGARSTKGYGFFEVEDFLVM
jgi:CRISPR-associated protein Cmr6